jgi:hypothetical protein
MAMAGLVVGLVALSGAAPVLAQNQMRSQQEIQTQERVYGSQLMTPHERTRYRDQLRNARTVQERDRIRAEHHQEMQVRARQRGLVLPDMPPAIRGGGSGAGPGGGPGR